ncbi:MAG: hypothetical protein MPI93_09255, partial [Nitrosopumilus sp.]|nr:hypothetical protein [Nitrosopumilus sp.]
IQLGAEGETVVPFQSNFVVRTVPLDLSAHASVSDAPSNAGVTNVASGVTINGDIIIPSADATGSILQDGLATNAAGNPTNRALYLEWDVTALGPDAKVKLWAGGGDYFTGGVGTSNTFLPDGNKGNLRIDNHPARSASTTFSGDLRFAIEGAVATTEATTITAILRLVDTAGTVTTLEETTPNSGIFDGTIEYVMLNQLNTMLVDDVNVANEATAGLATGLVEDTMIVLDGDFLDEDGIRVDYQDVDEQGQTTTVSAKTDAPTHSGSITLDQASYKQADTVIITLSDADLNLNNELRDVYTAITDLTEHNRDTIARESRTTYASNADEGLMLEATFDDTRWISCGTAATAPKGFGTLISSIRETAKTSGVFVADFQVPREYCTPVLNDAGTEITGASAAISTLGRDLEVLYYDFLDAAG